MQVVTQDRFDLPSGTVITLKEITDILEIRHDKAKQKIQKLIQTPLFGEVAKIDTFNLNGTKIETYAFDKRQAISIGAKLDDVQLMKIIDRLETPLTIDQLLEQSSKVIKGLRSGNILLSNKIEKDKPKVSYAEAVQGTDNPISIRDWVNTLKSDKGLSVGERKVFEFLTTKKYIYKTGNKYKAYARDGKKYFSLEPISISTRHGNKEILSLKITGTGQVELGSKVIEFFKEVA